MSKLEELKEKHSYVFGDWDYYDEWIKRFYWDKIRNDLFKTLILLIFDKNWKESLKVSLELYSCLNHTKKSEQIVGCKAPKKEEKTSNNCSLEIILVCIMVTIIIITAIVNL